MNIVEIRKDFPVYDKQINGKPIIYMNSACVTLKPNQVIGEMIKLAHKNNSLVLLDGAQAVPHIEVDVRQLDADFLVCSGHKMLGSSGTGNQIMVNLGGASRFQAFLEEQGIKHILCKIKHPQSNGKIEKWWQIYKNRRQSFNTKKRILNMV